MLARECPHCGGRQLYQDGADIACLVCGHREPQGRAYVREVGQERLCWPYPAMLDLEDDCFMAEPASR